MKKATLFKPNTGPSTDRHRTSRQSVRGRISAPIPMPDPLQSVPDLPGVPGPSGTGHEPSHSPMPQSPGAASFVPEATEAVPIAAPVEIQTVAPEPDTSGPTAATIPPASTALLSPSQRETGKISPASAGLSKTPPQQPSPASTPQPRPLSKRPAHAATAGPAMVPDIASAASRSTPSSERVSSVLQQRVRASSTLRYSEASVLSESPRISHGRGGSSDARPQRKKSGFRGAFSKLFSRRKQTDSSPPSGATPGYVAAPQHRSVRSDPTVLGRPKDLEPKRSTSLPLSEYSRALRSHSVGPGDMSVIESVRTSHQTDGPSIDLEDTSRSRTTTAASRIRIAQHLRHGGGGYRSSGDILGGGEWAGLSPRPASVHGRGTRHPLSSTGLMASSSSSGGAVGRGSLSVDAGDAVHRAEEIGRAISSDIPGSAELGHKRRSQSLSGLRDMTFGRNQSRRRSDEIRYWRESYDPMLMSPLSSGHDFDVDVDADDEADGPATLAGRAVEDGTENRVDESARDRAGHHNGSPSDFLGIDRLGVASPHSQPVTPGSPDTQQAPASPQPFSFGNLSSVGASGGLPELTQAASMDSRIGVLEARMHHVEHVVDRLCQAVAGLREGPASSSHAFAHNNASLYSSLPPIAGSASTKHRFPPPVASTRCSSRHSDRSGRSSISFDSDMHHSHLSFGEGRTYIGSLHPPSSSATQAQAITTSAFPPSAADTSPHPSTSTVKEAASLPTLGASVGLGSAPGTAAELVAQLELERAARQTLEAQIRKLNDRVNVLSTTMYAMVRDPAAKRQRSIDPLSSPMSSTGSFHDASSVTSPTSPGIQAQSARPPLPLTKGQQTPKAAAGTKPSGRGAKAMKPAPEDGRNSSVDPSGRNSPKRQRKTARTLSLGQLTLGKSAVRT